VKGMEKEMGVICAFVPCQGSNRKVTQVPGEVL